MTVRRPLVYDAGPANTSGTFRHLTDAELLEWQTAIIDVYAADPSSVLSVVSGSGTISPTMSDTRLQAGAENKVLMVLRQHFLIPVKQVMFLR